MQQLATRLALVKHTSHNVSLLLNGQRRTLFISAMLMLLAASPSLAELGDSFADLVYTPVAPCRVLDSRFATDPEFQGPFSGSSDNTNVVVLDIAINDGQALIPDQGGNEDGCPDVPLLPEPAAVVLTITAVPAGSGHFRAYAFNDPDPPLISVSNWSSGRVVANTTIVPACENCGLDVSLRVVGGPAHVIIDIMGYFRRPEASPLQVNVLRNTTSVSALHDILMYSPQCPSGWRLTGGGFHGAGISSYGGRPAVEGSSQSAVGVDVANAWMCEGKNNTINPLDVFCYVVCSRVPGWTD